MTNEAASDLKKQLRDVSVWYKSVFNSMWVFFSFFWWVENLMKVDLTRVAE